VTSFREHVKEQFDFHNGRKFLETMGEIGFSLRTRLRGENYEKISIVYELPLREYIM
jgi:hypothetical protein